MLSKDDGSGTTTFTWNEENQLTQVGLPNGKVVNYKYDGLGRRIQRTNGAGANERYVYDGHDVLLDLNANSSVATTYLNGLGNDNHLRQTSAATGVSYFLTDQLGSTAGLTDASGNLIEQIASDSFGNSDGSSLTRYGYTGRERDPDTGLMYYRARWYDPQVGRFISEDPIGFGGGDVNLYAYVKSNPISYKDPQGTFPVAGVAIGAAIIAEWSIHYYLMNRSYGLFPHDELGRKKHCYVNCMSVRIHLGGSTMATGFSIAQEIPTLVEGAVNGHFRREVRDTAGDLAADGFGQFMAYAIWRSCKEICDQCPGF